MKLPPFAYRPVESTEEATTLLAEAGDRAAVLAGGQSLLLDLRYGQSSPEVVVDVNRVAELAASSMDEGTLRLGALVRHADVASRSGADPLTRLLRRVTPYIAHPPIRALGTFVGSIAWAHPAAEWCALARLLDADVVLNSSGGSRTVGAADWFHGHRSTARRPDEVITEVRLPVLPGGAGIGFAEHRRSSASFALAAAAVVVEVAGGVVTSTRIGLANAGEVPWRATQAERVLVGSPTSAEPVAAAADAAAQECEPLPELHCSVRYRRHVIGVLVRRALAEALDDAEPTIGEAA